MIPSYCGKCKLQGHEKQECIVLLPKLRKEEDKQDKNDKQDKEPLQM